MSSETRTHLKIAIIGAGVIGCAVAKELTDKGHQPYIIEQRPIIAEGVTSRNSGVVHSGIYYSPSSLKARLCVRGQELLYPWCELHGVGHRKTGKWIVGNSEACQDLEDLMKNAELSGAKGLRWVEKKEIQDRLPAVIADLAIYCSETGIVDPYELSRSLLNVSLNGGATLVTDCNVERIHRSSSGYEIETSRGPMQVDCIFNCAGLYADAICKMVGIDKYQIYPWRGDYFKLEKNLGISELIYPIKQKNAPGLGIHLTVDLDGNCKIGPDVEYVESKSDMTPKPEKAEKFLLAASKYLRNLKLEDLSYDTCGIRPKLRAPTETKDPDFVIEKGPDGFFSLLGIESPGLTAAMAIAEYAVSLL